MEHLKDETGRSTLSALLAYFYCSRQESEPERANPHDILRSILKQLSFTGTDEPACSQIVEAYKKRQDDVLRYGNGSGILSLAQCEELILEILKQTSATIVIDALDECDSKKRHLLLGSLGRLLKGSPKTLRVFISSREENDIVHRLEDHPNLRIEAKDNFLDIKGYVEQQIDEAIKDGRLLRGRVSIELRGKIIHKLIRKSGSM